MKSSRRSMMMMMTTMTKTMTKSMTKTKMKMTSTIMMMMLMMMMMMMMRLMMMIIARAFFSSLPLCPIQNCLGTIFSKMRWEMTTERKEKFPRPYTNSKASKRKTTPHTHFTWFHSPEFFSSSSFHQCGRPIDNRQIWFFCYLSCHISSLHLWNVLHKRIKVVNRNLSIYLLSMGQVAQTYHVLYKS